MSTEPEGLPAANATGRTGYYRAAQVAVGPGTLTALGVVTQPGMDGGASAYDYANLPECLAQIAAGKATALATVAANASSVGLEVTFASGLTLVPGSGATASIAAQLHGPAVFV